MNVLVTGANGFLGRHVVSALLARGHRVRALVRPAARLDGLGWTASVEIFRADLHPALAANPLISFATVAVDSGTLEFKWSGDNGFSASASAAIKVV